jgi:DNA-binding transcriptional LysR family regulator
MPRCQAKPIVLDLLMRNTHGLFNLHHLRCFVETVEAGTMTGAGERLRLTQSAISLSIARLEDTLGTQLLIRSHSLGLSLTPAGRELVADARDLLRHADEVFERGVSAGRELAGELTVGCFRTTAPFVLPRLLETFQCRHPGVSLRFVEGPAPEVERALLEGRCELAIIQDLGVGPAIALEPLYALRPYVIVDPSHPLADDGTVSLAQLAPFGLVLLDVAPSAEYFTGLFTAVGESPTINHTASSYELVRSLVARGQGYGLLASRSATGSSYEGLPLVELELADDVAPVRFSLGWLHGVRHTARARAFADLCRAQLAR